MTFKKRFWFNLLLLGIASAGLLAFDTIHALSLRPRGVVTGWILLTFIILLGVYGVRKKLPFLPLGSSSVWQQFHIYGGMLTLLIFGMHIDWKWPGGYLEITLATLFIGVAGSGIIGLVLTRTLPQRITRRGETVLFERVPFMREKLRQQAEELVKEASNSASSTTLAHFYIERLGRFLAGPRNIVQHLLGSNRARYALIQDFEDTRRYLDDREREYFEQLEELALIKDDLDFQFTAQGILKLWQFVHVPLTYSLISFMAVHVVLVYAYIKGL